MALASALVDALEIDDDLHGFAWFGTRRAIAAPSLSIEAREARLVEALRRCLYQNYYGRGEPTPYAWVVAPPYAREDNAFIQALLSASRFRLTWFEGRVIAQSPQRLTCRVNGLAVTVERGARVAAGGVVLDAPQRAGLAPGSSVRLGLPGWSLTASPGFLILTGHGRSTPLPHRVYWHIGAETAEPFVTAATGAFAALRVPTRLKLLSNPETYETRRDCAVAYVDLGAPGVLEAVEGIGAALRGRLRRGVPAFTREIAVGVAIAEDPPDGQSFGMHRSGVLAAACLAAKRGGWSVSAIAHAIEQAFVEAGINPAAPWGAALSAISPLAAATSPTAPLPVRSLPNEKGALPSSDALLDAALNIGELLLQSALQHGERRQWLGGLPAKTAGNATASLPPGLYDGVAGIGLFLTELGHAAGAAHITEAGMQALRQALHMSARLTEAHATSPSPGFYIGNTGIAAAALRAARRTGAKGLEIAAHDAARACLAARPEEISDLLTGLAGTALGLLILTEVTGDAAYAARAIAIGDILLARAARPAQDEASWPHARIGDGHHPTGLSHGVSGIALVLTLLFERTGDERFRYAAARGLRHEDRLLDPLALNWPDYRFDGEQRWGMKHWCHGAGGILLCRPRLAALREQPAAQALQQAAALSFARTVERQARSPGSSYNLCHGLIGNVEILLSLRDEGMVRPEDSDEIDQITASIWSQGIARHGEAADWPIGLAQGNPSIMLGLAGIGYAALRLRDRAIPSILLPEPSAWA